MIKIATRIKYILICSTLLGCDAFAFDSISVGHISTNRQSSTYRNVVHLSNRSDNIERKTPSQLIAELFSGKNVNKEILEKYIEIAKQKRRDTFIGFCLKHLDFNLYNKT